MKTIKNILLSLTLCPLICACNTDIEDVTRLTKIDSIPTGAPIVINGMKVGKTPLSVEFECNDSSCFVKQTTITAIPQEAALHTQVISYPAFSPADPDKSRIPEEIIFDMRKNPAE